MGILHADILSQPRSTGRIGESANIASDPLWQVLWRDLVTRSNAELMAQIEITKALANLDMARPHASILEFTGKYLPGLHKVLHDYIQIGSESADDSVITATDFINSPNIQELQSYPMLFNLALAGIGIMAGRTDRVHNLKHLWWMVEQLGKRDFVNDPQEKAETLVGIIWHDVYVSDPSSNNSGGIDTIKHQILDGRGSAELFLNYVDSNLPSADPVQIDRIAKMIATHSVFMLESNKPIFPRFTDSVPQTKAEQELHQLDTLENFALWRVVSVLQELFVDLNKYTELWQRGELGYLQSLSMRFQISVFISYLRLYYGRINANICADQTIHHEVEQRKMLTLRLAQEIFQLFGIHPGFLN